MAGFLRANVYLGLQFRKTKRSARKGMHDRRPPDAPRFVHTPRLLRSSLYCRPWHPHCDRSRAICRILPPWPSGGRLRREFEAERRANIAHFDAGVAEWRRFAPLLHGNLRTLAFLRTHPGAPPSQWPNRMSWYIMSVSASKSAALQYMSRSEVQHWASFYSQLDDITSESSQERDGLLRAKAFLQSGPNL